MDETPSSSQHFAAGSYIDLLLAAVIMQITFIITAIWVGTNSNDLLQTNSEHVRHVLKIQLSLGWMMCIIAGLGFSLLPLIYDVKSFDKSLMRSFIGMNMSGQFTIALGIIIGKEEIFYSLSTIGITLLCTALFLLGPPALTIFKSRKINSTEIGPFSYTIGMILPFIGLITLVSWIARENSMMLAISESVIFDLLIPLAVTATIVSHFNRRLNWDLIKPHNTGKVFAIFMTLLLLSILSAPLSDRGDMSVRLSAILALLPYIFIFIMLNPKKIVSKIIEKQPYNKMIAASVFWLPIIGIASYLEKLNFVSTTDAMMSYYRWILIFGFSMQALWGFASYLHDDHKKLSLHRRKTTWLTFLSLNIGSLITTFALINSWITDEELTSYPRIGIAVYAASYILILIHWIRDVFFGLDNWYATPMFYDKYLKYPEEGPGYDFEN